MSDVNIETERKNAADAERKRSSDILALGEKHNCAELARKAVQEGKSVDEVREMILAEVYKAKPVRIGESAEIGMTGKEVKNFSIRRAILALANPQDRKLREAAAFEFDCSDAQAKKLGRQAQGFFIPRDVAVSSLGESDSAHFENDMRRMMHAVMQRDLLKGTGSAGGYTVATELLAASFIDLLRNRMRVRAMGATILSGLVGDIAIPRQSGGATAYWVGENSAVTESQQVFEQVAMTPKSVGAFTDLSRKLLIQSSVDVEGLIRLDLATVLALAIDLAAINGSGSSNQPQGILGASGIGSVAGGTNGAAPTWANIVALETALAAANADVNALGYLTNAAARGKLKGTLKTPTYGSVFCWEDMPGNPGYGMVNGYRAGVSNQVPNNLVKGSSGAVCSAIIFANWADLIIGEWGALDVLVDPFTGGAAGTVRVRVLQDVDVALRHPESFAAMQDALTS